MPRLLIARLLWLAFLLAVAALLFVIATAAVFAQAPVLSTPEASEQVASGDLVLLAIGLRESGG